MELSLCGYVLVVYSENQREPRAAPDIRNLDPQRAQSIQRVGRSSLGVVTRLEHLNVCPGPR
jgi:hypothetical protein